MYVPEAFCTLLLTVYKSLFAITYVWFCPLYVYVVSSSLGIVTCALLIVKLAVSLNPS